MENPGLKELRAFKPQFVLYWGRSFAHSQYAIWEPYLKRSRFRFLVLVDGKGAIPPHVVARGEKLGNVAFAHSGWSFRQLKQVPSMVGILYVGHRPQNFSAVRALGSLAHVWLGHGHSGKRAYANRVATLYDSVYLGSYKDLRQYDLPVRRRIRTSVCAIGAPIVEGLLAPEQTGPPPARPKVVYLPTWEGYQAGGGNYTSLELVLESLQASPPTSVEEIVLRSHPATGSQLPHMKDVRDAYAAYTSSPPPATKAEAMNRADVGICDFSGATSEFLFTRKPIVLPWGRHLAKIDWSLEATRELYPYAYVWDVAHESFDDAVQHALHDEELGKVRRQWADDFFRGHRSLDEAAKTFDAALSVLHRHASPVPLRALFEAKLLAVRKGLRK